MLRTWFISLFCLTLFCIMLIITLQSHGQVKSSTENIQYLVQKRADLKRWDNEHRSAQLEIKNWNDLRKKVIEAKIEPKKWQVYPVNIQDTFDLHEAERILRILSNSSSKENNFLFSPEYIRVMPVVISQEGSGGSQSAVEMQVQGKMMTMRDESF
ncbi:MAG: hypothetical protein D5R98_07750 [Desulfonatronovibrio sp. MSAO_Bac4]|nr:MAG: hypothetical protein D5R98_07750 [Desulfonatronovibrio sp. MSAO_Bac4]